MKEIKKVQGQGSQDTNNATEKRHLSRPWGRLSWSSQNSAGIHFIFLL